VDVGGVVHHRLGDDEVDELDNLLAFLVGDPVFLLLVVLDKVEVLHRNRAEQSDICSTPVE